MKREELVDVYERSRGGEVFPEGTWRIDPALDTLEQLRRVRIADLHFTESTTDPSIRASVERYAEMWRQGLRPPPPEVVRHVNGHLVTLNRRRVLGAQKAGASSMLAWVSETSEDGSPQRYEENMSTKHKHKRNPDDESVDDIPNKITGMLSKWHHAEVKSLAEDYIKRIKAKEFDDADELMEDLDQTIDGHQHVIYTYLAKLTCLASDNEGAYEDATGEEHGTPEQIAYFALKQDVLEEMERQGVDPNDSDDWFEDEEEERENPGFMQPVIEKGDAYVVETSHGTEIVPADLVGGSPTLKSFKDYCEGKPRSFEKKSGYLARMSAPGYLDVTAWSLHETAKEAKEHLEEMYGEEE